MNYILNKLFSTPLSDQASMPSGFGVHPNGVPIFKGSNPPPGFEDILATIQVDQLPEYASAVRKRLEPSLAKDCLGATLGDRFFTEYNVFYTVVFADDVKWIFKVPGETKMDSDGNYLARIHLRYKASLMRVLRRETSIPVPDVYDFNDTCDNELNCPFTLMEYITGVPLMETWFDTEASPAETKTRRTRALTDLAAAMVQLDRYRFDHSGMAVFDTDGRISGTAFPKPTRLDITPEEVSDLTAQFTPQLYYIWRLNGLDAPRDNLGHGAMKLLKMLFEWIPTPADDGKGPFVLAQMLIKGNKILVGPDGAVQAILGWDYAEAVPRAIGNDAYPPWLMVNGFWCDEEPEGVPPPSESEETLAFYRKVYADQIQAHRPKGGPPSQTRNSIIYLSLMNATKGSEPFMPVLEVIMRLILREIREEVLPRLRATPGAKAAEVDLGMLELSTLCQRLHKGDTTEEELELLKMGYEALLSGDDIL